MAQIQYTVTINDDGSISTKAAEASDEITRTATTFDIFQTSKELVAEIETQVLADRVARLVVTRLQPADPSAEIKAKIIDALSDRGIDTPVN